MQRTQSNKEFSIERSYVNMALKSYLAFDLGASSGRAIVGSIKDDKIVLNETHRFINRMVYSLGHYYWDILGLFEEIKVGLRKTAAEGFAHIFSLGVDTWGVDFALVGSQDTMVGFPYAYRDTRLDGIMEKAFNKLSRSEIYKVTGIQFMQFNSIFQLYSLVEEKSPLLEIAETLLFIPDMLNYMLTGQKVSEYTIASTSQLLDPVEKRWQKTLFDSLDLPISIMPDIIMPGSKVGSILPDILSESGLRKCDVYAPGCHDTASAVAAVPATGENWAYLSSGTWSLIGIEIPHPIITNKSLENNFTNEGGVNNTIRFLRNVAGLWLLQGCRKSWQLAGEDIDYDQMIVLAENSKPFKCLVNPDDEIFLNPPDMPSAIAEFCIRTGQSKPERKGEYVRCILESLAFKYKSVINKINDMIDRPIQKLHIVGGGCQNELLNQLTANATGLPVIAGPVEATAIGNVLIQAIASGEFENLHQARQVVKSSFPTKEFEPQNISVWQEKYQEVKHLVCS